MARVRINWDDAQINQMLTGDGGMVDRAVARAAGRTRDRSKANVTRYGRVDTGQMRNTIRSQRLSGRPGVWYEVGTDVAWAMYQHDGTQAHGPRRAKAMRFKSGATIVFAKRVAGVKPAPFLKDALDKLSASDFNV